MIKAVVFDMDGLLADTETLHFKSFQMLARKYGHSLSHDAFREFVGVTEVENIDWMKKTFGIKEGGASLVAKRKQMYLDLVRSRRLEPVSGLRELLEFCVVSGLRRALASSASAVEVKVVLERLSAREPVLRPVRVVFDEIVTGSDVQHNKPHPEIYLTAAERLGLPTASCVALEDSEPGVESAKAAGMRCFAVPTEHTSQQDFGRADAVLGTLLEVVDRLRDLVAGDTRDDDLDSS